MKQKLMIVGGAVAGAIVLFYLMLFLSEDLAPYRKGDAFEGDRASAGSQRLLHRPLQTAAAGHFHPHQSHRADIVQPEDLGELFAVIHRVQLGTANDGHLALHVPGMEIPTGKGRTADPLRQRTLPSAKPDAAAPATVPDRFLSEELPLPVRQKSGCGCPDNRLRHSLPPACGLPDALPLPLHHRPGLPVRSW